MVSPGPWLGSWTPRLSSRGVCYEPDRCLEAQDTGAWRSSRHIGLRDARRVRIRYPMTAVESSAIEPCGPFSPDGVCEGSRAVSWRGSCGGLRGMCRIGIGRYDAGSWVISACFAATGARARPRLTIRVFRRQGVGTTSIASLGGISRGGRSRAPHVVVPQSRTHSTIRPQLGVQRSGLGEQLLFCLGSWRRS